MIVVHIPVREEEVTHNGERKKVLNMTTGQLWRAVDDNGQQCHISDMFKEVRLNNTGGSGEKVRFVLEGANLSSPGDNDDGTSLTFGSEF